MAARPYDNALRRENAAATRTRILDAVRDLLVDSRLSLSIPEIAERAGVSEPTVYRHFPNREALLDAAAEAVSAHLGAPPEPRDANDLPVVAIALARYFGRNASWVRAALNEPALRPMRMAGRSRRLERLRRIVSPRLAHLDARDRDIAFAVFAAIARTETWDYLTRESGLSNEESGAALSFALRALLETIATGKRRKQRRLVAERTMAKGRRWGAAAGSKDAT